MGESADQIREELDLKREDAAQKIEQLENHVNQTAENVKQSVDLRHQIEQRPLTSLGVAFVGGFILGGVLGGDDEDHRQDYRPNGDSQPYRYQGQQSRQGGGAMKSGLKKAVKDSGLESTLTNVAAAAMATASDRLKSTIDQSFPGFAGKYDHAQETEGGMAEKGRAAREESAQQQEPVGSMAGRA